MKRLLIALTAGLIAVTTAHAQQLSNEQATAAFNALQDKHHRPHLKIGGVTYDAKTDSYHWVGPKLGKPVSMSRTEFESEMAEVLSPTPLVAEATATPAPSPSDPSDPWNSPEYKDLLKPQTKAQKEEEKKEAKKSSNQPEQYEAQDNSPHRPGDGVTKSGYYATVTKEDLKAVTRYAVQQDLGAIQSMVNEGRAVLLQPGMRVHIEESPFLSGEVKCRRIGTTFSFWTVSEAISEY